MYSFIHSIVPSLIHPISCLLRLKPLKVDALKIIAGTLNLTNLRGMRKVDLVAAIVERSNAVSNQETLQNFQASVSRHPYRRTQVNSRGEPRSWRGCPCNGKTNQSGQVLECASCKGSVHAKCLRIAEYLEHVQINAIRFTCPMCLLKDMDPFYPMV
eukprot:GHVU01232729.1.p1 GENE.GHVU01232729.1~~GHVU01232729.1.p1  ORF type:complete len:157 (+),score=8.05 GHVU01232729.1:1909-2379(+)